MQFTLAHQEGKLTAKVERNVEKSPRRMPRRFFDYSQKIGYMKSGRCWMQYQNIRKAIFLERPNRFIAHVELGGSVVKVHVKNTGRCPGTSCSRMQWYT